MQKLSFLVGKWRGPATAALGPGEPLMLTQTEHVQYKLDGLLMLIEGAGLNAEGRVLFSALATISFDDATGSYRFRAFNRGRYLDTELKVRENGVSWGYTTGPLTVENVMTIDAEGAWVETTDVKFGDNPKRRTVEMRITREK